jgi:hypothetical protein
MAPRVLFACRHARLASLLNKLRTLMCPESKLTLSPEKTHPLALSRTETKDIIMNKVTQALTCLTTNLSRRHHLKNFGKDVKIFEGKLLC